jgi:hypothetical protein
VSIEIARQRAQRRIALVADPPDDRSDIARDILVRLAPRIDERIEGGREAGIGGR